MEKRMQDPPPEEPKPKEETEIKPTDESKTETEVKPSEESKIETESTNNTEKNATQIEDSIKAKGVIPEIPIEDSITTTSEPIISKDEPIIREKTKDASVKESGDEKIKDKEEIPERLRNGLPTTEEVDLDKTLENQPDNKVKATSITEEIDATPEETVEIKLDSEILLNIPKDLVEGVTQCNSRPCSASNDSAIPQESEISKSDSGEDERGLVGTNSPEEMVVDLDKSVELITEANEFSDDSEIEVLDVQDPFALPESDIGNSILRFEIPNTIVLSSSDDEDISLAELSRKRKAENGGDEISFIEIIGDKFIPKSSKKLKKKRNIIQINLTSSSDDDSESDDLPIAYHAAKYAKNKSNKENLRVSDVRNISCLKIPLMDCQKYKLMECQKYKLASKSNKSKQDEEVEQEVVKNKEEKTVKTSCKYLEKEIRELKKHVEHVAIDPLSDLNTRATRRGHIIPRTPKRKKYTYKTAETMLKMRQPNNVKHLFKYIKKSSKTKSQEKLKIKLNNIKKTKNIKKNTLRRKFQRNLASNKTNSISESSNLSTAGSTQSGSEKQVILFFKI